MEEPLAQIDIAQLDAQRCFVHLSVANEFYDDRGKFNVPWDARTVLPDLPIPTGMAAQFSDETNAYTLHEDHRRDALYVVATSDLYTVGDDVEGLLYDGLGAIPAWLTDVPPALVGPE